VDKVLVIGGRGFIGNALVNTLLEHGDDVTVVSRSSSGVSSSLRLRYARADVADAEGVMRAVEGHDVVYDLSMSMGSKWEDYERDYIGGSTNVARACLRHKVRRLIYTSSISALFMGGGGVLRDADGHDPHPEKRGFYGRAKVEAERVLMRFHASDKLPVVIFRPGIVLGTGGWLVHPALGEKVNETRILGFGDGKSPLPCVLVEDVASALYLAKDAPGIDGKSFNLAGDIRPTALEYVRILRDLTRRNIRYFPRSVMRMGLAENSRYYIKKAFGKPDNVLQPVRDAESLTMSAQLDCSEAKRLLGWRPVSDRTEFIARALGCHVEPLHPGDLRLSA